MDTDELRRPGRRWLASLCAVALLAALAVAAYAQTDADNVAGTGTDFGLDTDVTPVAKEYGGWQQVAGADFGADHVEQGSVTSFRTDLYAVAFRNSGRGFAGGATCREEPQRSDGESLADFNARVSRCDRVPVIYSYAKVNVEDPSVEGGVRVEDRWQRVELPGGDQPGYVGAIAFIDATHAFAVGGTGSYVRREEPEDGNTSYNTWVENDPARAARAWLWQDGQWSELKSLPAGMRGLTAVAFSPPPGEGQLGFAGGLGQLWEWRDGRFTGEKVDRDSPAGKLPQPQRFRYRVRAIALSRASGQLRAFAATAGCCDPQGAHNAPLVLQFDGAAWRPKDSLLIDTADGSTAGVTDLRARPGVISYLDMAVRASGADVEVLNAPDGRESGADLDWPYLYSPSAGGVNQDDIVPRVSTARLVAFDGDRSSGDIPQTPRWSVGLLRSSGQAVVRSWHLIKPGAGSNNRLDRANWGLNDSELEQGDPSPLLEKGPFDAERAKRFSESYNFFRLPAYALNAIDMVEPSGSGWAVGDRGAILKVGDTQKAVESGQRPPPNLGRREPRPLSTADAYDAFPLAARGPVGPVPSFVEQPPLPGHEPAFVPSGWVDPGRRANDSDQVRRIVMTRSGAEGWALETPPSYDSIVKRPSRLYHYDGEQWRRCDPVGVPGQVARDDACAEAELTELVGGQQQPLPLFSMARVPLEYDGDPSNDDELELVAVGAHTQQKQQVILRYRDGRWRPEAGLPGEQNQTTTDYADVAFATPDDGFALVVQGTGSGLTAFYHFNGKGWVRCASNADEATKRRCGNLGGRLPLSIRARVPFAVAGRRIYLYGWRASAGGTPSPLILHRDPGGEWTPDLDPAFDAGQGAGGKHGIVRALAAVSRGKDYEGWALATLDDRETLLHLDEGTLDPWTGDDASADYLDRDQDRLTLLAPAAAGGPFVLKPEEGPLLFFDEAAERWKVLPAPFIDRDKGSGYLGAGGQTQALTPDGEGGFWAAVRPTHLPGAGVAFEHYARRVPTPVFEAAPQPLQGELHALAATPDGQVWAAEGSGLLARYDRLSGWERVRISGWDSRTRGEEVNALALGSDGRGVAVGQQGRVAQIGPDGVVLDPAAGTVCGLTKAEPPCGTSRDLNAAAIAPDGSTIAGGNNMAILWRPAGGDFRSVGRPLDAGPGTRITAVALPRPDRAHLATDAGEVWEGALGTSGWRWRLGNVDANFDQLTLDENGKTIPLRAIALDADGHGYAVGDRGLVLERTGDSERPWRRLKTPHSGDLTAVALPSGGGEGALIGGQGGLILTGRGRQLAVARPADPFAGVGGTVVGLAFLPGLEPGQVEAWAAVSNRPDLAPGEPETSGVVHYSSDLAEPLLNPAAPRARALADAPAPRESELSFGAFGKSDCSLADGSDIAPCSELSGTNAFNELVLRGIVGELAARSRAAGDTRFVLFTGDVSDQIDGAVVEPPAEALEAKQCPQVCSVAAVKHNRFLDLVAEPLNRAALPLFGAIGVADLDESVQENAVWRRAMERRPAPWGVAEEEVRSGELRFEPAPGQVADDLMEPTEASDATGPKRVPGGRGRTNYAVDVRRDEERIARIVVVDSSQRSLAAGDPFQQPLEPRGGQSAFLERMLCFEGQATSTGDSCTRKPGQQVIVLSESPTYSYGPGARDNTATDGAALEATLLRGRASVLVSGRIGWQGRYWATAPGLHEPCPGEGYRTDESAPEAGGRICGRSAADLPVEPEVAGPLAEAVRALGAPAPPSADELAGAAADAGILPVVVSSSAGGNLADAGEARDGFWHGYSIVRLDASGDPRKTVVEQRPIFDWVQITAQERTLRPGQRMTLRGVGREPLSTDGGVGGRARYDRIDSPAITHRYDLVAADSEKPWLPKVDPDSPEPHHYVPLDPSVATVDRQTGAVRTGKGNHPRVYALAILSVGSKVATYPLVFEPRKSFVPKPPKLLPAPIVRPVVLSSPPNEPPPSPPSPQQTSVQTVSSPAPPAPPPPAQSLEPPPITAPPPPPPPAPPGSANALALNVTAQAPAVAVLPLPGVFPPPAPPVQPAPPSGARREARQRQAAAAKSEEVGADEATAAGLGQSTGDDMRVELAQGPHLPPGAAMTRRARARAVQGSITGLERSRLAAQARHGPAAAGGSFSVPARPDQPSAWARGALYGSALALAALVLSLGFTSVRPTPRRSGPRHAAAAQCRAWSRWG